MDWRDATKSATLYAAGLLTTISIPDVEHEAARSLLHCRADLTETITRSNQRILVFLLTRQSQYIGKSHWIKTFHTGGLRLTDARDGLDHGSYLSVRVNQLVQEVRRIRADLVKVANRARYLAPVKVLMAVLGVGVATESTLIF